MTPRSTNPRRWRLRHAASAAVAVLCAVSYTTTWIGSGGGGGAGSPPTPRPRRSLSYLDVRASNTLKYGRAVVDQNFQSLLWPSRIDSSIFRKTAQDARGASAGYDESTACDDVFLFMPYEFAHNGHGSQLNNYLLAAMMATFSNRAMVILEPPNAANVFKSNSQFGCPPEAWRTKMVRTGGKPKRIGWDESFPVGLDRLVKHPAWLSRQCPVPCRESHDYDAWDGIRNATNVTLAPVPREVRCATGERDTNVIVMGGPEVRDYFAAHYRDRMLDRSQPPSIPAAEWALRLGAAPHEARVFSALKDRHEIWDYVSSLMTRSGMLRFQPWIARDAEAYVRGLDLPLDAPYYSVHVRRGDKLESDARRFVIKHWQRLGLYDEETGTMPRPYIPFSQYLARLDDLPCSGDPKAVYVATDDPEEVMREVAELPRDAAGDALSPDGCHRYRFVFGKHDPDKGYHIDGGKSKGDCDERYDRNIAAVADLMILAKSDVYVGEFNSNWGRLVHTFRLTMNDSNKIMNGARPVIRREMRVAWGNQRPGPPGW